MGCETLKFLWRKKEKKIDIWIKTFPFLDKGLTRRISIINTWSAGIGFNEQNCLSFVTFEIPTTISRINEPIPGMFVLI